MNQIATIESRKLRDYSASQLDLIKRTVAADCNNDEFNLFVEVARRVGLDPFRRQIYAMVYSKGDAEKRKLSIVVGIDGFRAVAARAGDYRPDDQEYVITYDAELKHAERNPLGIERAAVKAFKIGPDKQWHPVVGVAYWDEFAPIQEIWEWSKEAGKRQPTGKFKLSERWHTMGRLMIAKCAEAQALRKGWPEDLSGLYAPEEMDRAGAEDQAASAQVEQFQAEQRLRLVNAADTIAIQWEAGQEIQFVPLGQLTDKALAFVNAANLAQLNAWEAINRNSLKEYWARNKSEALEFKKALEARKAKLALTSE